MTDRIDILFGENMQTLMSERGFSYRELSALTGIGIASLHEYANAKTSVSLQYAKKISSALGSTVDEMTEIKLVKKIAN